MKEILVLILVFGTCLPSMQAADPTCEFKSSSGANSVKISTPVSFLDKELLNVPNADYVTVPPAVPKNTYSISLTVTPGQGWTTETRSGLIAQPYGGSGQVLVKQVIFKKSDGSPATGQNDAKQETIDVKVFVIGITVSVRATQGEKFTPLNGDDGVSEYDKHDVTISAVGVDQLGVLAMADPRSSDPRVLLHAGIAYEFDGVVAPVNLGVNPGGLPEAFKAIRSVDVGTTENGNVDTHPTGFQNDSKQMYVDGTPSKNKSMIYDGDEPRINFPAYPGRNDGTILQARWNFKEHFELKGIRFSPEIIFSIRRTVKKVNGYWTDFGDNWIHLNQHQTLVP